MLDIATILGLILIGIVVGIFCLELFGLSVLSRDKKSLKPDIIDHAESGINEDHGVIGKNAEVHSDFIQSHSNIYQGAVVVNGTKWKASCVSEQGGVLKAGDLVKVVSLKGNSLEVAPWERS